MYGMCHQRHRHESYRDRFEMPDPAETGGPVVVARRDPDERVSDADRERAAALLSEAFRDGVLRVEEFDQRLSAAYAAQTVADLDAVTRDLPSDWISERRSAEDEQRRATSHAREWRAGFRAYRGVMLLLVSIWFLTNLDDFTFTGGEGEAYFWPIWPILGWGIPLLLSRPRDRGAPRPRTPGVARAR